MEAFNKGKVDTYDFEMSTMPDKRHRRVRVWTPENYDGVKRFPVIYMHDGQEVLTGGGYEYSTRVDQVITGLIPSGISAIVVAIDTADTRMEELTPDKNRLSTRQESHGRQLPFLDSPSMADPYADFVVTILKPFIDENYLTLPDVLNTTIAGDSAGGTMSYYMFFRDPEVFGRCSVCSPSFPLFDIDGMLRDIDEYDFERMKDHRISFYNGDQGLDVTSVDAVLKVYRKLREKMDNEHLMFLFDSRETHCDPAWNRKFPEIFTFLFKGWGHNGEV